MGEAFVEEVVDVGPEFFHREDYYKDIVMGKGKFGKNVEHGKQ